MENYGQTIYQTSNLGYGSNILPVYNNVVKRSKCPRGATLGKIGSACGTQCTRACAIE